VFVGGGGRPPQKDNIHFLNPLHVNGRYVI
jgi:hypothetical protein